MHSSRMSTVRCSGHPSGGGCLPKGGGGGSAWGGSLPAGGMSTQEGGVHLLGGCRLDPPVNRITDKYKNITLPQLRCGR